MLNDKCYFCNKKERGMSKYFSNEGKKIHVCYACQPYAERRALRKISNREAGISGIEFKYSPSIILVVILLTISFIGTYIFGNGSSDLSTARLFGAIMPTDATTDNLIRTVTYTFQQIGGPIHLILNLSVIIAAGPFLEKVFGPFWFTILFLVTGAVGGIFILIFSDANVIAGGASGAAYGLIGLYVGLMLKKYPWIDTTTRNWVLNLLWINIIWTLFVPGISIAGHLGGLISGIILSFLFPNRSTSSSWIAGLFQSIIGFGVVIIIVLLPSLLIPNTELPFIQDIRAKIGKEILVLPAIQNDELIYSNIGENLDTKLIGESIQTTLNEIEKKSKSIINDEVTNQNVESNVVQTIGTQTFEAIDINQSYLVDYEDVPMTDLFNTTFFGNLTINSYPDIVHISGFYSGEIIPREDSYLEFTLVPEREGYLKITSVYYNGELIDYDEGIQEIVDIISTPLQ